MNPRKLSLISLPIILALLINACSPRGKEKEPIPCGELNASMFTIIPDPQDTLTDNNLIPEQQRTPVPEDNDINPDHYYLQVNTEQEVEDGCVAWVVIHTVDALGNPILILTAKGLHEVMQLGVDTSVATMACNSTPDAPWSPSISSKCWESGLQKILAVNLDGGIGEVTLHAGHEQVIINKTTSSTDSPLDWGSATNLPGQPPNPTLDDVMVHIQKMVKAKIGEGSFAKLEFTSPIHIPSLPIPDQRLVERIKPFLPTITPGPTITPTYTPTESQVSMDKTVQTSLKAVEIAADFEPQILPELGSPILTLTIPPTKKHDVYRVINPNNNRESYHQDGVNIEPDRREAQVTALLANPYSNNLDIIHLLKKMATEANRQDLYLFTNPWKSHYNRIFPEAERVMVSGSQFQMTDFSLVSSGDITWLTGRDLASNQLVFCRLDKKTLANITITTPSADQTIPNIPTISQAMKDLLTWKLDPSKYIHNHAIPGLYLLPKNTTHITQRLTDPITYANSDNELRDLHNSDQTIQVTAIGKDGSLTHKEIVAGIEIDVPNTIELPSSAYLNYISNTTGQDGNTYIIGAYNFTLGFPYYLSDAASQTTMITLLQKYFGSSFSEDSTIYFRIPLENTGVVPPHQP